MMFVVHGHYRFDSFVDVMVAPLGRHQHRLVVRVELESRLAHQRHQKRRQATAGSPRRKWRDRQGFDVLVERGVVMLEGFVVRQVPWPGPIENHADKARMLTTDTARR